MRVTDLDSVYKWLQEEAGETKVCDCCGHPAPLRGFTGVFGESQKFLFCEPCASSDAGNSAIYPRQYTDARALRHACRLHNMLLDALTGRKPPGLPARAHDFEPDIVLADCRVCKGGEGSLTTDCPGFQMNSHIQQAVYLGGLDFKDGVWTVAPPKEKRQ
jgi:hypothetical protein